MSCTNLLTQVKARGLKHTVSNMQSSEMSAHFFECSKLAPQSFPRSTHESTKKAHAMAAQSDYTCTESQQ